MAHMNGMLVVIIGVMAGVFAGLFGIGGGIVIVPALVLFAGFPLIKATGTSLAAIMLPVGILGVITYYRARILDLRAAAYLATGLLMSVVVGAWLAHTLPADIMRKLYAIFCLYVSWTFIQPIDRLKKSNAVKDENGAVKLKNQPQTTGPTDSQSLNLNNLPNRTAEKEISAGPDFRASDSSGPQSESSNTGSHIQSNAQPPLSSGEALAGSANEAVPHPHFLALIGTGLVAGVMAGMFGIGGGNIIVPFLVLFLKYPPKRAIATSLAALLPPIGLPGVIYYYKAGTLDLRVAALLAAGLLVGTVFGARINIKLPTHQVKLLYGLFLIFVAIRFLLF